MFKHRHKFICLIVILMALTLSAAAAQDNSTDSVLASDVNVSSGSFEDLGDAIYYANDSDVITVEGEYVKGEYQINVEKSVTIQSEGGAVIDANNTDELFFIDSCDVTFKNIAFVNSPYESIYLRNASLTLLDCTFINGGIRFYDGSLSIINSTFTGSHINTYSLSEYGDLNIENSEFYTTDFSMYQSDFINVNICDSVFIDPTGNPFNINCQVFNFKNNFITACPHKYHLS